MPPAPLPWVSASVPKRGNAAAENEDATAAFPARMRYAVADGATEGWQSRGWARHVAAAFLRNPPDPDGFTEWLEATRKTWVPPATESESWYAEAKREQGSFATLLGIELRERTAGPGYAWKAVAIGDSCLLVARGSRFAVTFPLSSPAEFGSRPALVPSTTASGCPEPEWLAGRADPGDVLLLATDAVARHLLGLDAAGRESLLGRVNDDIRSGSSDRLLEYLLNLTDVLNDDASLVAVRLPAAPEPPR